MVLLQVAQVDVPMRGGQLSSRSGRTPSSEAYMFGRTPTREAQIQTLRAHSKQRGSRTENSGTLQQERPRYRHFGRTLTREARVQRIRAHSNRTTPCLKREGKA